MSAAAATNLSGPTRDALVAQCYQQLHQFLLAALPPSALQAAPPASRGRQSRQGAVAAAAAAAASAAPLPIPLQRFAKSLQLNNVLDAATSPDVEDQRAAIRAALIAMPVDLCRLVPGAILNDVDTLLQSELQAQPVVDAVTDLVEVVPNAHGMVVWQGDMSLLRCDAVVNPGNSALLGCFLPSHRCLDNILHAQSGLRLRLACADEIERLGIAEQENTGICLVTSAYALPSQFVFHTVGPCLVPMNHRGPPRRPTKIDAADLERCYRACLDEAAQRGLQSIAFCCISTGIFGYPSDAAAYIAITTCLEWQQSAPVPLQRIVFNVFKDEDLDLYNKLLPELIDMNGSGAPGGPAGSAATPPAAVATTVVAVLSAEVETPPAEEIAVDDDEPE